MTKKEIVNKLICLIDSYPESWIMTNNGIMHPKTKISICKRWFCMEVSLLGKDDCFVSGFLGRKLKKSYNNWVRNYFDTKNQESLSKISSALNDPMNYSPSEIVEMMRDKDE